MQQQRTGYVFHRTLVIVIIIMAHWICSSLKPMENSLNYLRMGYWQLLSSL